MHIAVFVRYGNCDCEMSWFRFNKTVSPKHKSPVRRPHYCYTVGRIFTVEDFEQLANPANCAMVVMELQENGKYELVPPLKKHTVAHGWRLGEE